jgi:NTE family protein
MLRSESYEEYRPTPLSQILRDHFAGGSKETVAFVEAGAQYVTLEPGETLLHQGEPGDDVYFVLSGRLRAQKGGDPIRVLGEIGRGESVGELAMFTGEVRSASIIALRRSLVARISRELIERAIARRPEMGLQLTRRVVERFRRQDDIRRSPTVPVTLALVPISPGVDAMRFAQRLRSHQPGRWGSVAVLAAPMGATRTVEQHGQSIDALEHDNAAVYLVADGMDTDWTRACLTHADEVLLLADATGDPRLSELEQSLVNGPAAITVARKTLVLLHDRQATPPHGTAPWLAARGGVRHFHIRPTLESDMARMARIVSGRAVGLVLGGGGAPGLAHIGVYQALESAGVPIDFVGGTSIGALMGTLIALDVRGADMERSVREGLLNFPRGSVTGDFNLLPLLSLIKGTRARDSLVRSLERHSSQSIGIEDAWKPFFAMAANFSYGREEILDFGPMVPSVTASFSIPGVLPPVLMDGSLMFDGGAFNNLPLDVMARRGVARVIGVDVTNVRERPLNIARIPSALALLRDRLRPRIDQRYRCLPTLPETMLMSTFINSMSRQREQRRYADLLFHPDLPRMGLLDWHRFDEVVTAGRTHAVRVLAEMGDDRLAEFR